MSRRRFSFDFASPAFTFVLMMGVVNLFSDMTYEGGGSINGQFMALLGATALAISITAGLGEFLGYTLRPVAGYIADKTGRYWTVTFVGYTINLLAVPAMSLSAFSKLAPVRSILLTKAMRGTSYLVAWRQTVSDWGWTPATPQK